MKKISIFFIMIFTHSLSTVIDPEILKKLLDYHPFAYNLGIKIIPSKKTKAGVTICCHGYGHSHQIVDVVHSFKVLPDHLIGFNFPDYGITAAVDHAKSSFGTIQELLPLLFILKRCVCDLQISTINLYGFSAGGGAIINALVVLRQSKYDVELGRVGITAPMKQQIMQALERGLIILDCPLKSIEEILIARGKNPAFEELASHYVQNSMRPLESVQGIQDMKLNILLHFQNPDEVLGNRDDTLFIERLRKVNKGKTGVVIGADGGHNAYHASLWKYYKKNREK